MGDDVRREPPTGLVDRLLKTTECPFTWDSPLPSAARVEELRDMHDVVKHNKAMVWSEVIGYTVLASASCRGAGPGAETASRRFTVEAYMRIMPTLWDWGLWQDDLVQHYGLALRHLVDATWAHICREFHGDDPAAMRDLSLFLQNDMVHASSLCDHFQAALVAIQAEIGLFPGNLSLARKAVQMNPDEGQWHCVLARVLWAARHQVTKQGAPWLFSMQEEMTAAQRAFDLLENVDTFFALARINEDLGYYSRTVELLRAVTTAFPDNACALWQAADMIRALPKPHRDRRRAVLWYERSIELLGDSASCMVHSKLGCLLMERGDTTAAREHLRKSAWTMGSNVLKEKRPGYTSRDVEELNDFLDQGLMGFMAMVGSYAQRM